MPPLLSPSQALHHRDTARQMALEGDIARACFLFSWAAMSLQHAGDPLEAVRTRVLLAWAQGIDNRPWQAVATMHKCLADPEYAHLPQWVRARAEISHARALWVLGKYHQSLVHAREAQAIATDSFEASRAAVAVAHIQHYLGHTAEAEAAFDQALLLDPDLAGSVCTNRAYLHNLRGEHKAALAQVEDGLNKLVNSTLETRDNVTRAAERAALMVERGTAKAFLGHRDAREALMRARKEVQVLASDIELDEARITRAWALVLIRAREPNAARAFLLEANRVFRQRRVQPEQDLSAVVATILDQERR